MRRMLLAVGIALLVAAAGCHQETLPRTTTPDAGVTADPGAGEGSSTPTATPARATRTATPPATRTPETTPTPDPTPAGATPPGVHDDGSVNETRIAQATFRAMNDSGYRLRHRNGPNRTVAYGVDDTTYVRDDRGATWTRGNLTVTNDTLFGPDLRSAYDEGQLAVEAGTAVVLALAVRLGTADYEWRGTRTVDGTRLHVLELVDTKNAGDAVGHYTGTMLVDGEGRVHRLSGTVGENESAAVEYRFDFEWGVEEVPRPSWVDAVPRVRGDRVADGRVLEVRVAGGAAIPAGTELTFRYGGDAWTTTLSEPLAPGESLYFALRREDGARSLVVAREPPDDGELVDVSEGQVRVDGTVELADGRVVDLRVAVGRLDF